MHRTRLLPLLWRVHRELPGAPPDTDRPETSLMEIGPRIWNICQEVRSVGTFKRSGVWVGKGISVPCRRSSPTEFVVPGAPGLWGGIDCFGVCVCVFLSVYPLHLPSTLYTSFQVHSPSVPGPSTSPPNRLLRLSTLPSRGEHLNVVESPRGCDRDTSGVLFRFCSPTGTSGLPVGTYHRTCREGC